MVKKKVLWLGDFCCATGFANVNHNIVRQLLKTGEYEIDVIGINYMGDPHNWPIRVYPAIDFTRANKDPRYQDLFGRQRVLDLLGTGQYDIFFSLQDTFIMEEIGKKIIETRNELKKRGMKTFKWIFYFPVDGKLKPNWVSQSVAYADYPVTYTNFAFNEVKAVDPRQNPKVIFHGTDLTAFRPLPMAEIEAFKQKMFGQVADDKFIVTNVNRNQRRKDIPRTIIAFSKFHQQRPDSLLYLHMNPLDVGGNLHEMCRYWGLAPIKDYVVPDNFSENHGWPIDVVNQVYNMSDVVISTTLGEGWGLSSTEAFATKTPIIFPNNTSLREIVGKDRGRLVKSGSSNNLWTCLGAEDWNQFRPLTDVDDLTVALIDAYDHPEKSKEMAENAYKWVQDYSWEKVCEKWIEIFREATEDKVAVPKIGRNDPCPFCNDGVTKWKKCIKHNEEAI